MKIAIMQAQVPQTSEAKRLPVMLPARLRPAIERAARAEKRSPTNFVLAVVETKLEELKLVPAESDAPRVA